MKRWEESQRQKTFQKQILNAKVTVVPKNQQQGPKLNKSLNESKQTAPQQMLKSPQLQSQISNNLNAKESLSDYYEHEKDDPQKIPIYRILKKSNLQQYAKPLITRGFGYEVVQLLAKSADELAQLFLDIKVLPGHKIKLENIISHLRSIYETEGDAETSSLKRESTKCPQNDSVMSKQSQFKTMDIYAANLKNSKKTNIFTKKDHSGQNFNKQKKEKVVKRIGFDYFGGPEYIQTIQRLQEDDLQQQQLQDEYIDSPRKNRDTTKPNQDPKNSKDSRDPKDFRNTKENKEQKDPKEQKDFKEQKDSRDRRDIKEQKEPKEIKDQKEHKEQKEYKEHKDHKELKEPKEQKELLEVKEPKSQKESQQRLKDQSAFPPKDTLKDISVQKQRSVHQPNQVEKPLKQHLTVQNSQNLQLYNPPVQPHQILPQTQKNRNQLTHNQEGQPQSQKLSLEKTKKINQNPAKSKESTNSTKTEFQTKLPQSIPTKPKQTVFQPQQSDQMGTQLPSKQIKKVNRLTIKQAKDDISLIPIVTKNGKIKTEIRESKIIRNINKQIESNLSSNEKHQNLINPNLEYEKIKHMYSSFDSGKLTSTLLNLDIEELCFCLGNVILKHVQHAQNSTDSDDSAENILEDIDEDINEVDNQNYQEEIQEILNNEQEAALQNIQNDPKHQKLSKKKVDFEEKIDFSKKTEFDQKKVEFERKLSEYDQKHLLSEHCSAQKPGFMNEYSRNLTNPIEEPTLIEDSYKIGDIKMSAYLQNDTNTQNSENTQNLNQDLIKESSIKKLLRDSFEERERNILQKEVHETSSDQEYDYDKVELSRYDQDLDADYQGEEPNDEEMQEDDCQDQEELEEEEDHEENDDQEDQAEENAINQTNLEFSFISKYSQVIVTDNSKKQKLKNRNIFYKTFKENSKDNALLGCPTIEIIKNFCKNIIITSKMEKEAPILALVYIERLIVKSQIQLKAKTWRKITLTALIISSKIWDDESFENNNFAKAFPAYQTSQINEMERIFLNFIEYNLYVKGSEYAKYYFILRAFANKNKKSFPLRPLDLKTIIYLQRNANKAERGLKEAYGHTVNKSF